MFRWWIGGFSLFLALACGTSPDDPALADPELPPVDAPVVVAPKTGAPVSEAPSLVGRIRDRRRSPPGHAPRRGGAERGRTRPDEPEDPAVPMPSPSPSPPSSGGGKEPATVGAACAAACDHVVECNIATFDECTAQCPGISKDELELALSMSCTQLRAVIDSNR